MHENLRPGMRVEVQFGQRKHYAAIVFKVNTPLPAEYRIKSILGVLDAEPVVTPAQLQFWQWMSEYYLCAIGEVMQAALPSQLKLESTTVFMKDPRSEINILELEDDEYLVASALEQQHSLTLEDMQAILQRKTVVGTVKKLLDKGVMIISEMMDESYKPKLATFVVWSEKYKSDVKAQRELLNMLITKPQQMRLMLAFYDEINKEGTVLKSALLKRSGVSASVLNTLIKNEILNVEEREHTRLSIEEQNSEVLHLLSPQQKEGYKQVKEMLTSGKTALLYGVTA
ncbi:MAG TPA: hypothetical protein VEB42_03475, partial [Chitinophagaceae bacterium]|nr:hypothetical protein [Chitinophagaceae bacterium]